MKRLTALLLCLLCLACAGTKQAAVPTAAPTATPTEAPTHTTVALTAAPTPTPSPAPTATPTPAPTPEPTPTPTPTPEPTPTPVPTPFTIVWISDTQNESWMPGRGLQAIVDYVLAERENKNIQAVVQTGDIVELHDNEKHWQQITDISAPMRAAVPFYCVAGNHDIGAYFKHHLTYDAYLSHPLCCVTDPDRQFEGGKCWYELREDLGLLLLGMGWALDDRDSAAFTDWAGEVLSQYPDYPAILVVHCFVYTNGELDDNGVYLEEHLLSQHPNLRLVLCGHHDGATRWSKTYDDGHTVTAMMLNFQDDTTKSRGYCTWLTFDPLSRSIAVTTYSPFYDDYNYYSDLKDPRHERETFTLENAW